MQLQPARCIGVAAHQFARRTTLFQVLQPRIASKDREIGSKTQLSTRCSHSSTHSKQQIQRRHQRCSPRESPGRHFNPEHEKDAKQGLAHRGSPLLVGPKERQQGLRGLRLRATDAPRARQVRRGLRHLLGRGDARGLSSTPPSRRRARRQKRWA